MTKLSTPFQLLLLFSLFLHYIPPSVQILPAHSVEIHRRYLRFARETASYRRTATIFKHDSSPRYMHSRSTLEQNVEAQGNSEYFVQVGFGTPPKPLNTVLDIGSDVTWIQCNPCAKCYNQTDPVFEPANSSSYKPLLCNSQQCQQLNDPGCNGTSQTCHYEIAYGDGSYTSGDFATESLSVDNTTVAHMPIGCGHKNTGSFANASGILGLGRGSLSYLSRTEYSAFAYCLTKKTSSSHSFLQFGSSATFNNSVLTIPMLLNSKLPSFYFVGLTGVSVNNEIIPIPPIDSSTGFGGSTVNFGTTVTRFPPDVHNQLCNVFAKAATGISFVGRYNQYDICYDLASHSTANFPTVAFHFGAADVLTLPQQNVMFDVDNYTCFGFSNTTGPFSVIGSHQQHGIRISFDEDKSVLGFLPGDC